MTTVQKILATLEAEQIRNISLWFTDITGTVKSITIPVQRLESIVMSGAHFDGSSIDAFAREAESDMLLLPDLNTFAIIPADNPVFQTARLICNVHSIHGDLYLGDPRAILINAIQSAKDANFVFKAGMELEFYVFEELPKGQSDSPIQIKPIDQASYFDASTDVSKIHFEMLSILEKMNIPTMSSHHEIGSGQHEIDMMYAPVLEAADRLLTTRAVLKWIAQRHQLHCSFMPRPSQSMPGSGLHTHQSLHDAKTDENLFSDPKHEYGLSKLAQQFLAGQLAQAGAMSALLAPLVNSYKRLGTSVEAPTEITWARYNRAALIRVPSTQKIDHHGATRLEIRLPDPAMNPYLGLAAMLTAGLDGIQQGMELGEPSEESVLYNPTRSPHVRPVAKLPRSLRQAVDELEKDDVLMNMLGNYLGPLYLDAKRLEYREYRAFVTEWELRRYFNTY